ncbi:putative virion membrane protein [Parapoxvirus red deer/HL953]|uniref:Putative virion membrane protein n=1 Tax=Parapoxvirus red deer/HL953 TaxID=1579460 RepID=A0A0A7M9T1_9POXV|nr:putative virion membrane protein [Parapoxvirus red deer/HL953]AIZ77340.1 putative virion membrane protein [Parapoxvirus red deer/HL953]
MELLNALLTIVVVSIVSYIIIMMYRRAATTPSVPRRKDPMLPGASTFDDRMTDDQVRALHDLVTSHDGPPSAPAGDKDKPN